MIASIRTAAATVALAAALPAAAQTIPVSVQWSSQTPTAATIITYGHNYNLALSADHTTFQSVIPVQELPASGAFSDAELNLAYSDNFVVSLPLRLSRNSGGVAVWIARPGDVRCTAQRLSFLQTNAGTLQTALASYVEAKAIYQLQGSDRCGSHLMPQAAKVWFDRSYALTRQRDYFRLDADARQAYDQYDHAYAEHYAEEDGAHALKIHNDQKLALAKAGDYSGAVGLNATITTVLSRDADLAAAAAAKQGLTDQRLKADGLYLQQKAAPSFAASPPAAASPHD